MMGDDFSFTIDIPCDDDGYVLLQCPQCGEFFKLRPDDYEADEVLEVRCPSCGMVSDNYLTEEVVDLVLAITENKAFEALHKEMKRLERKTRGKAVSFKASKAPQPDDEPELRPSVDALKIVTCRNCGKRSKIPPTGNVIVYLSALWGDQLQ